MFSCRTRYTLNYVRKSRGQDSTHIHGNTWENGTRPGTHIMLNHDYNKMPGPDTRWNRKNKMPVTLYPYILLTARFYICSTKSTYKEYIHVKRLYTRSLHTKVQSTMAMVLRYFFRMLNQNHILSDTWYLIVWHKGTALSNLPWTESRRTDARAGPLIVH